MKDPFRQRPAASKDLTGKDIYYNKVDERGNVGKYKVESGVPVKVADLGSVKDYFQNAITKAALMTPDEISELDFGDMTHIEIAAIRLAMQAAYGRMEATKELFDRIMGKAKLISESTTLSLTLDELLSNVQTKKDVIDVGHSGEDRVSQE